MAGIIVAFQKVQDAKTIRTVLVRSGFDVHAVCSSGAGVLQAVDQLQEGIIVCGFRLSDMLCTQLLDLTAPAFSMLLISSGAASQETFPPGIWHLRTPVKAQTLVEQVRMLQEELVLEKKRRQRGKRRSPYQQETIDRAKALLMERNHMSEEAAHRYLQRTSMESGTGLVETAAMLLSLMEDSI